MPPPAYVGRDDYFERGGYEPVPAQWQHGPTSADTPQNRARGSLLTPVELGPSRDADSNGGIEGEEADIAEDAYGAAVVAIIKEMQEMSTVPGKQVLFCLFRLAFAEGILLINILLQYSVLMFIESHVVETSITRVQWLYKDFHEKVFDEDRKLVESLWENYENKEELCQIGMTNHTFFMTILFLWTMNQMKELREAFGFIDN